MTVVISSAKSDGALKVSDIVMIAISPCMLLPVICLKITSLFVDVNTIVKTFDQNNA
jgi:hypothetical protein